MAANYIYGGSDIIDQAREEFRADGVLSTSTYTRLTNAGYNADAIIERFTNEAQEE